MKICLKKMHQCLGVMILLTSAVAMAQTATRPNILMIMADDIGPANVGIYTHGLMVPTPNIDRLAKEGMLFTDHYAEPSCTAEAYFRPHSRVTEGGMKQSKDWTNYVGSGCVAGWGR